MAGHGLGPIKRLWMYLVRQEKVQNFFIKFIFGRKAKVLTNLKGINTTALTESASFISDVNTGNRFQSQKPLKIQQHLNSKIDISGFLQTYVQWLKKQMGQTRFIGVKCHASPVSYVKWLFSRGRGP